ncbi:MAG: hypothetical protein PHY73_01010 [Candidatus Omnitrophica bacterium]|nr:hypothetical protein [Candidatus Omnitrophota bacterium]
MSKAAKQVIFILCLLLAVSVFVALSTFNQKSAFEEENAQLQGQVVENKKKAADYEQKHKAALDESAELKRKADALLAQKKDLEDEIDAFSGRMEDLKSRVEEATQEKEEWRSRYQAVQRERDDAIAKLQVVQKQQAAAATREPVVVRGPEVGSMNEKDTEQHWANILKERTELEIRIGKLESELDQSALDIEELRKKNSDLDLEIGHLNNSREEAERKLTYNNEIIDNLSIALVREKNDKKYINERLEAIKEENLMLRAQVKQLSNVKIALEKSVSKVQEEKAKVEKRLAETEIIVQDRIDEVMDIKMNIDERLRKDTFLDDKNEIMLPPIIVNGSSSSNNEESSEAPFVLMSSGEIISVNDDNNFVIIDLGEETGIKIGDQLTVYRDDEYIGELEVIQVRKDISAADIIKISVPLKAGDIVK